MLLAIRTQERASCCSGNGLLQMPSRRQREVPGGDAGRRAVAAAGVIKHIGLYSALLPSFPWPATLPPNVILLACLKDETAAAPNLYPMSEECRPPGE